MIIPDIDYQAEVKKCKTMEDVVGKNGSMQKLFKDVIQQLLKAEMEELYGIDAAMISKITDKVVEAAYICMALDMKGKKRYFRYLNW